MKHLSLAILAILIMTTASCSSPAVKAAEASFIDCSKADISQAVTAEGASLFEAAAAILMQGGAGWQDALTALGKAVGADALACAVKAVEGLLEAHADGTPTTSMSPAAARAIQFLHDHPEWKFASH